MGVGAGLYMCDVVKKFTFAISSPDEFLYKRSPKRMKRHKAPGLSGLSAEMIHATEGIETQWLLDLCNGIVKECCIPEDWMSSVILPIYRGKVIQWSVDLIGGLNCWNTL